MTKSKKAISLILVLSFIFILSGNVFAAVDTDYTHYLNIKLSRSQALEVKWALKSMVGKVTDTGYVVSSGTYLSTLVKHKTIESLLKTKLPYAGHVLLFMQISNRLSIEKMIEKIERILDDGKRVMIRLEGYPLQDTSTVTYTIKSY